MKHKYLPFFSVFSSTCIEVFPFFAANALNIVASDNVPLMVWACSVLACRTNGFSRSSMVKRSYSPSPLNVKFCPSKVLKCGSPQNVPANQFYFYKYMYCISMQCVD